MARRELLENKTIYFELKLRLRAFKVTVGLMGIGKVREEKKRLIRKTLHDLANPFCGLGTVTVVSKDMGECVKSLIKRLLGLAAPKGSQGGDRGCLVALICKPFADQRQVPWNRRPIDLHPILAGIGGREERGMGRQGHRGVAKCPTEANAVFGKLHDVRHPLGCHMVVAQGVHNNDDERSRTGRNRDRYISTELPPFTCGQHATCEDQPKGLLGKRDQGKSG